MHFLVMSPEKYSPKRIAMLVQLSHFGGKGPRLETSHLFRLRVLDFLLSVELANQQII